MAGGTVRGPPRAPARSGLSDARFPKRGGRRRPGSLATPKPLRHKHRREPWRMADHGRRARVPGHAALAQVAREESFETREPNLIMSREDERDPAHEVELSESVGVALLVVLETLAPAERVAFVLHDMFDLPFDEIGSIVGRSATAARQLASRARRRVRGGTTVADADRTRQREVVEAFLAASRDGDFEALLAVLDPGVVVRADRAAVPASVPTAVRGAPAVAKNAIAFSARARFAQVALVNGVAGIVVVPNGRLRIVLAFTIRRGRIVEIDVVADPERLRQLVLGVFND